MLVRIISWIIVGMYLAFLTSCEGDKRSAKAPLAHNVAPIEVDSVAIREAERVEKRKLLLERQRLDSLEMERVFSDVLSQLEPELFQSTFTDSLEIDHLDLGKIRFEMEYDFLLSRKQRNLLIRRFSPGLVQIDLFSVKNGKPSRILDYQLWEITYINDTLQDVNGDGLIDFVVNGYGSSGCCLKAFSEVFLVKKDLESFSPLFHFINPTFSGREGIIRGVCYGHPGETEMYKYKWRNYSVDTIEYISYQRNEKWEKTGKVTVSNHRFPDEGYIVFRVVPTVPMEYLSINGYDWFADQLKK